MSADEFDPVIERLFSRSPQMVDAAQFASGVQAKLHSSTRMRKMTLGVAGLVGGVIAVREAMNLNLHFSDADAPVAGRIIGQGVQAASQGLEGAVNGGLSQVGLDGLALGSMGAMQLFWIAAGLLIAVAAAGVMKLSQSV